MATNLIDNLRRDLDLITSTYEADFSGQSRATRDVAQIDGLIKRLRDLVSRANGIPAAVQGPELIALRDDAQSALSLYETERVAILKAKEAGPIFDEFAVEATDANFVFARYARHFAGQNRSTRDVALLAEMLEELKGVQKRMSALLEEKNVADFGSDLDVVKAAVTQYTNELKEIDKAQKSGSAEEQAGLLATLANDQFAVYQTHFAGQARISRRPALLMRVIDSLKSIKSRMEALKLGGFSADYHDKNIGIVQERLAVYETELGEIRKARQGTALPDIMGNLGNAANEIFEEYRKGYADKSRAQVDYAKLGQICDRLGEVKRQMRDLSRAEQNEMNEKNLEIVVSQLSLFESEYEEVGKAQAQAKH